MEKDIIEVARLYSGELIIGKRGASLQKEPGLTFLSDPRAISLMPAGDGRVGLAFRPLCPFGEESRKGISLRDEQIMVKVLPADLPKDLIDGYLSEVSGIGFASPADVPDLTGEANPGSFTL